MFFYLRPVYKIILINLFYYLLPDELFPDSLQEIREFLFHVFYSLSLPFYIHEAIFILASSERPAEKGISRKVICEVLYVSLRGIYGVSED